MYRRHTHTHTHARTHAHTHIHTLTHAHTKLTPLLPILTLASEPSHILVSIHVSQRHTHTHTHTRTQTHTHTYTHTHTHTHTTRTPLLPILTLASEPSRMLATMRSAIIPQKSAQEPFYKVN